MLNRLRQWRRSLSTPAQGARVGEYLAKARAAEQSAEGSRSDNVEAAIAVLEAALQETAIQGVPAEAALIQQELGVLYSERIQGDRSANLERAIELYCTALKSLSPRGPRLSWAITQFNLSRAYTLRIEGDRKQNLERATEHAQLALPFFAKDPGRARMIAGNLNYIKRKGPLEVPCAPGPLPQDALRAWQVTQWRNHEAELARRLPQAPLEAAAFATLAPQLLGQWPDLDGLEVRSSRWAVATTPDHWHILDVRTGQTLTHKGPETWLEMAHLGPFAPLAIEGGRIRAHVPFAATHYEDAIAWLYDSGGDSVGTHINLSTGARTDVYSPRLDMSREVWIWRQLARRHPGKSTVSEEAAAAGRDVAVQPTGRLALVESSTGTVAGELDPGSIQVIAGTLTPDGRILLTVSSQGEVHAWRVPEGPAGDLKTTYR